MKRQALTLVITLLAAAGAARADAVLLANGSFEAEGPSFVAGSYCYLGYAPIECGSLPGWAGGAPVIRADSGPWGNASSLPGWTAALGDVLVGLQNESYVEQTLALAPGQYRLSWSDAGRAGYDATEYTVSFNGATLGSFATTPAQGWAEHSLLFSAVGAGDLRFQGLAVNADGTAFIDGLSVTAVPEPTSVALLLAGLAALGATARRRRS